MQRSKRKIQVPTPRPGALKLNRNKLAQYADPTNNSAPTPTTKTLRPNWTPPRIPNGKLADPTDARPKNTRALFQKFTAQLLGKML